MQSDIFQADKNDAFKRLDKVLVKHYPQKTRNYFKKLITDESVLVNDKPIKPGMNLKLGDKIEVNFPVPRPLLLQARAISLNIIYEDENVLVINKPADLVMHPGNHGAHIDDSLVNAVLHYSKGQLSGINGILRPGIVHRLDKDTSGLVVVAKNEKAQLDLSAQFKARTVKKTYYALIVGHLTPRHGMIEAPIARDRHDRKKMAVSAKPRAKEALTRYKVLEYLNGYSFVEVTLLTGRTHQIRVHFAAIGFPLIGDKTYGRNKINEMFYDRYGLKRQFLHAGKLAFTLPGTKKEVSFKAPLPMELAGILKQIRDDMEKKFKISQTY